MNPPPPPPPPPLVYCQQIYTRHYIFSILNNINGCNSSHTTKLGVSRLYSYLIHTTMQIGLSIMCTVVGPFCNGIYYGYYRVYRSTFASGVLS
jgi:hypothetical protein